MSRPLQAQWEIMWSAWLWAASYGEAPSCLAINSSSCIEHSADEIEDAWLLLESFTFVEVSLKVRR